VIQKNWEEAFRTKDSTALKDTYKHFVSCAWYLNLFEGITSLSGERLRIKRIIVGPQSRQGQTKNSCRKTTRPNNIQADVSASAIPYLG
jgi:hypothetical protein